MRSIQLLKSLLVGVVVAVAGIQQGAAQITTLLLELDQNWRYNDTKTDLGTAWREVAYNDAAWPLGEGPLGFPANEALPFGASVQTLLAQGAAPQTTTFYFRTHFNYSGSLQGVTLTLSNLVDDGAVFYLNGAEVGRVAMPTGTVAFATLATRASDIGTTRVDLLEFPADALLVGDNVLAVELHQGGATSSDVIFGTVLVATSPGTGPVTIITQPQSVTANQGENVTLRVGVAGTPPYTFQWYKDGEVVPGATGEALMLTGLDDDDAGTYFVTVQNAQGSATSANAILTIQEGPITLLNFGAGATTWSYLDSGASEPSGWQSPAFNDAAWATGFSPLGFPAEEPLPVFPPGGAALTVQTTMTRTVGRFSYYFRTKFNFTKEPLDFELLFTTLFDDGAVIYINGTEVARPGMEAGTVGFGTSANRSIGDAGLETFTLPGELLKVGENVMAVELHQTSADSSDMINGVRLVANPLPPTPIMILQQPVDTSVEEVKDATLSVSIVGNTPRFQWFRVDGGITNAIPGANRSVYTLTNASLAADNGTLFFVTISNVINRVTSDAITLTVIPDTKAPRIVRADGTLNLTTVTVTFDEPLLKNAAQSVANYRIAHTEGGANIAITSAVLTNGTNVILTTAARLVGKNYILTVNNVVDLAPIGNIIAANSRRPITSLLTLIRTENLWQYWNPNRNFDEYPLLGSQWYTDPDFDLADLPQPDPAYPWFWRTGNASFVNDAANQDLPAPRNTSLIQTLFYTDNFRTTFDFNASPAGAVVRVRHVIDDGALVYLNGTELFRYNLSEGPVTTNTPANATVGAASFQTVEIPAERLNRGENLIAVELHQVQGPNRDVDRAFALQLTAVVESLITGPVVITSDPQNVTAVEGTPAEFSFVGVAATGFQWRRNGVNIPGATNSTYRIERALLADNGANFSVQVSGVSGSPAVSGNGTLTVMADMIPPRPLSAVGAGSTIRIQFDEWVSTATGNQTANYSVTNSGGAILPVVGASTTRDSVLLTLSVPVTVGSVVRVANIRDASVAANLMPEACYFTVGFSGKLIGFDSAWLYEDSDTDLGTAWRDRTFADGSWSMGDGLLGQENATLPFPLRTAIAAPGSQGPDTVYFRHHFNLTAVPQIPLNLSYVLDDGAVFYLNGQEIQRVAMDAGQTHTNFATRTVGDAVLEGPFAVNLTSLLQVGDNVMAVEVHTVSAGSSDIVFGAELALADVPSVKLPPPPPPPPPMFLSIQRVTMPSLRMRISWSAPADRFVLERSVLPTGPWIPFPRSVTASPATSTLQAPFGTTRYFRLRQVE